MEQLHQASDTPLRNRAQIDPSLLMKTPGEQSYELYRQQMGHFTHAEPFSTPIPQPSTRAPTPAMHSTMLHPSGGLFASPAMTAAPGPGSPFLQSPMPHLQDVHQLSNQVSRQYLQPRTGILDGYPNQTAPPPPATNTYQLNGMPKLVKDAVIREFVLVENRIAVLEHQLQIAIQQNTCLRDAVLRTHAEMMQHSAAIEKRFDERLELEIANMKELAISNVGAGGGSGNISNTDTDSDDEVRAGAEESKAAAGHNTIKVREVLSYVTRS